MSNFSVAVVSALERDDWSDHDVGQASRLMAEHKEQLGTGKHPHKSSEDPRPHTKETEHNSGGGSSSGSSKKAEASGSGESGDLKEREYRDADGEVHHHTKSYMEQHSGEQGSKGTDGKESGQHSTRK